MRLVLLPVLLLCSFVASSFAARILVMFSVASKSHKFSVMPIAEELARRGHQITVISPYKPTKKVDNIHEIVLPEVAEVMDDKDVNWFEMEKAGAMQIVVAMAHMRTMVKVGHEALMKNQEFRTILEERKVDLIIFDTLFNEYAYAISDYLKVPFVSHNPSCGLPAHLATMGVSQDYASIPTAMADIDNVPMTFFQRLGNMMQAEAFNLVYKLAVLDMMEGLFQNDFPGTRSFAELEKETSLFIINSHPATAWPRALPPNAIALGALHTRPAQPLAPEFLKFADEAKDGFVVFTLGSYVPVSSMPQDIFQAFFKVFSKIPQRVIWKWEAEPPKNLPSNIMTTKWLPQQDLLGHPNARLFITHGGLLGTQEAVYHAVPLLYLPFGLDQRANANKAKSEGFGLRLDWKDVNEEKLYNAVHQLINNPSFKGNATRLSNLLRDELISSKEVGAYWIEHVLRHGGTKHLQLSGRDMPFYQRYLLDVFAFLLLVLLLGLFLTYHFIRLVIRLCFRRQKPKPKSQ